MEVHYVVIWILFIPYNVSINKEKPLLDLLKSFVVHFALNSTKNYNKNLNHNEEEEDSQCHRISSLLLPKSSSQWKKGKKNGK